MKSAKLITVSGKVQGVYYRASTVEQAKHIGVSGWVKNQADGTVLVHAEGTQRQLSELISWCGHGPAAAVVSSCTVIDTQLNPYEDFTIIR